MVFLAVRRPQSRTGASENAVELNAIGANVTHDEYMALSPQTKYQIEKERRATHRDAFTQAQLEKAREMMNADKEKRKGRKKK